MNMALSHNRIIKERESPGESVGFYIFPEEKEAASPPRRFRAGEAKRAGCGGKPQEGEAAGAQPQDRKVNGADPPPPEGRREGAPVRESGKVLEAARREAERILTEAREEAERAREDILTRAGQEAEKIREEARQEGSREGFAEGRRQAAAREEERTKESLLAFEKEMRQALASVKQAKETCLETYLGELKDCSIAVAEKVIHISLRSSGEVIRQMIVAATEKLSKSAWVKIYIDRLDYEMLIKADRDVLEELSHLSDNIKFIVMDREEEGTCVIERPDEVLDISVNSQMENIKEILENA